MLEKARTKIEKMSARDLQQLIKDKDKNIKTLKEENERLNTDLNLADRMMTETEEGLAAVKEDREKEKQNYEDEKTRLQDMIDSAKKERDAAVVIIKSEGNCWNCKHVADCCDNGDRCEDSHVNFEYEGVVQD